MEQLHAVKTGVAASEAAAAFYRQALGVQVVRRVELAQGLCIMNDLAPPGGHAAAIEMIRRERRNDSHLAYVVPDLMAACRQLQASGAVIHRPSRDGAMACVLSPSGVCAEFMQGSAPVGRSDSSDD